MRTASAVRRRMLTRCWGPQAKTDMCAPDSVGRLRCRSGFTSVKLPVQTKRLYGERYTLCCLYEMFRATTRAADRRVRVYVRFGRL